MCRLLLPVLALLLAACFDVREEVRIERDGSGRLTFDCSVPRHSLRVLGGEPGIRERIDRLIADDPRIRLEAFSVTPDGDDSLIHIDLIADSMLALMELQGSEAFDELPAAAHEIAGSVDTRLDGLRVVVERRIDLGRALGLAAVAINRKERDRRQLEYILHLPEAATDHNADHTENHGRTLIWRRSLGEALAAPVVTRYTAPIPLPAWVIPAAILLALLAVLGLVSLVRRLRRRRLPTS